jgi:vacuolar-type H+-ATPase catalytic subunit A/Vma1
MKKLFIITAILVVGLVACREQKNAATNTNASAADTSAAINVVPLADTVNSPKPNRDTSKSKLTTTPAAPTKEAVEKAIANTDVQNMAKDICACMQPVEKELTPEDINVINSIAKDFDKDMLRDSVAAEQFKAQHQTEMFKMLAIFMRVQKHMKPGAPAFDCMQEKKAKYGNIGRKPNKAESIALAQALDKSGCKLLSALNKMGVSKMF